MKQELALSLKHCELPTCTESYHGLIPLPMPSLEFLHLLMLISTRQIVHQTQHMS